MKNLIFLSIVTLVMAISLSSCKSHEKCPAYGKVEKRQNKSI